MAPVLDEVKTELSGAVRILKIDVDKNQAVSAQFKVKGVPTFILFKGGEILWRFSGAVPKQDLLAKIRPHLN